jgi:RNA polymerase sigma factor (sigma-70 family)
VVFREEALLAQDGDDRCGDEAELGQTRDFSRTAVQKACVEWESDLKGFLLGVLKNSDLVDDAFQRTALRAIEAAQSVRSETLRGWLFRIALNEARQLLRQVKRDVRHRESFSQQIGSPEQIQETSSNGRWLLIQGIVKAETIQTIQESLLRLPAEQQEVIRRKIYEEQTFAEIAEQMELPIGTVLTWMRRGLLRMKQDSNLRTFVDDSQAQ